MVLAVHGPAYPVFKLQRSRRKASRRWGQAQQEARRYLADGAGEFSEFLTDLADAIPAPGQYTAAMKFIATAIALVSIGLGFASPFFAVALVQDTAAPQVLMHNWFYGIPAEAIAVTLSLLTALIGTGWLMNWMFAHRAT